jgi:uridine phosphorylase
MSYFDIPKEKWQDFLNISDKDIPSKLIIEGNINFPKCIERRQEVLSNIKQGWMPNLITGEHQGELIGYAACFGGPPTSQLVHIYCKMGTKKIIHIGVGGGLQKDIELGDVIVSESVLSLDGSAELYKIGSNHASFNEELNGKVIMELEKRNLKYHVGKTVSYFDILLEKQENLIELSNSEYIGVEMEAAAAGSVANHFNVPAISFYVVSDNSISGKDLFYKQTENERKRIKDGCDILFDIALRI